MKEIFELDKFYAVKLNGESYTIVRVTKEDSLGHYFARYLSVNNIKDYLPGGDLFLGYTLDEAVQKIEEYYKKDFGKGHDE